MANEHEYRCPICDLVAEDYVTEHSGEQYRIKCPCCGEFRISRTAAILAQNQRVGARLSAWIRDRSEQGVEIPKINSNSLEEIKKTFPTYRASDKQLLLMRAIERRTEHPGGQVVLTPDFDYPLAWAARSEELDYYLGSLEKRGLINQFPASDGVQGHIRSAVILTPEGWDFLDEHAKTSAISDQVFVAMSFASEFKPAWENAIEPALSRAGFKGYRVDIAPHIEKIDAKIMTEIKNSRFLVADVTRQRQGVYFEAGYAMGLGLPVFWSVREDDLDNIHFDTRQYNHIVWKDETELSDKLYNFVCAVVGKGPAR